MHIRHGVQNGKKQKTKILWVSLCHSYMYLYVCIYTSSSPELLARLIEIRCLMGPVKTAALLGHKPFLGLSTPFNCWHYC